MHWKQGLRMRSLIILFISLALFGVCSAARADHRDVLHFDRSAIERKDIRCDLSNQAMPEESNFVLVDYALMSSESGKRLAIVTVKNDAGGQRILTNKDMVALLANCEAIYPFEFTQTINPGETISRRVSFGRRYYPIMKILMGQ